MAVTSTNNLRQGSKGDDVLELQKLLNQNGYSLAEDGSFGPATLQAVKDYQQKNGLAVDGIVGTNTWGKLTSASSTATDGATAPEATETPKFEYTPYAPSDTVKQAEALLQQQLANKPGAYTSPIQDQLNEIMNQINNREKFSYDLNGDMLYQQYKDQYTTQGKLAMMDTMGQAAALTGGYGNSYAQTAGQQAYQGYLQNLNDKIPELYQLALNQYNQEGDDLYKRASLIAGMEEQEYGRWRDQVSDYWNEVGYLSDDARYKGEQDYNKWADDTSFRYQEGRDKVAEDQWERTFAEGIRQFDLQYGPKSSGSSSGGGSSSSSSGGGGGLKYSEEAAQKQRELVAAGYDVEVDGKWGPASKAAWEKYQASKGGLEDKGYSDFDKETYSANVKENGGSYYQQALSALKSMKAKGKSNAEAMAYLSDMVGYSYISRNEYMTLYNKYRDNRL